MRWWNRIAPRTYVVIGGTIIALAGVTLYAMGRVPWCACGSIKPWHWDAWSSETSQHLTDPYTFSHIIHGFGFFWLTYVLAKRLPVGLRGALAIVAEAAWEIFENTPFIINRYRETTVSLNYYGDSILNSMGDILSMVFGFWLAARLRFRTILALTILMEAVLGFLIRDNLTLNIIMLIHPIESIRKWQMGG